MDLKTRKLIIQIIYKDQKAEKTFWEIWSPKIMTFIKNYNYFSDSDVEDFQQEIMLKIYKSFEKYNFTYSPSTWIYTIARNTIKDRLKMSYKNMLQIDLEDEHITDTLSPEKVFLKKDETLFVQDFIYKQTPLDKQIIFLVFYDGISGRQAAKILNMPAETVRDHIKKIKQKLKERYCEYIR